MIIDGDVISETIGSLKYDGSIPIGIERIYDSTLLSFELQRAESIDLSWSLYDYVDYRVITVTTGRIGFVHVSLKITVT